MTAILTDANAKVVERRTFFNGRSQGKDLNTLQGRLNWESKANINEQIQARSHSTRFPFRKTVSDPILTYANDI